MRNSLLGPFVVCLAVLSAVPAAAAQTHAVGESPEVVEQPQNAWTGRPLALVFHGAPLVGSPTGQVGGSIDYSPTSWASAWLGAGLGGGDSHALQLAAMARLRIPLTEVHGIAVGGGISGGKYTPIFQGIWGEGRHTEAVWQTALWANGEVSLELRASACVTLRPFLGLSVLMNKDAVRCITYANGEPSGPATTCPGYKIAQADGTRLPYAGLAVGYAFRL